MKKYIFLPTLFLLFTFFFCSKQIIPSVYAQCEPSGTALGCDPSACASFGGFCAGFTAPECTTTLGNCTTDGTASNPTVVTGLCVKLNAVCTPTDTPTNTPTPTPTTGGQTGAV